MLDNAIPRKCTVANLTRRDMTLNHHVDQSWG